MINFIRRLFCGQLQQENDELKKWVDAQEEAGAEFADKYYSCKKGYKAIQAEYSKVLAAYQRERDKPAEVIAKHIPVHLQPFQSLQDLKNWLGISHVDHAVMLKETGGKLQPYDCDDYALRLARDARRDKYELWVQIIIGEYKHPDTGKVLVKRGKAHALNMAVIGNECYFIEPQTDEVWRVAKVD